MWRMPFMRRGQPLRRALYPGAAWRSCEAQAVHSTGSWPGSPLDDQRRRGSTIIRRAIEEPLRWIAQNAGVDGSIVVDKVKGQKGANGFNAATETYEDLIKAGVIDPAKVVRTSLQNAASVSGLLLTTEAMIADKPEPKGAGGGGGMPDMGGMGGMPGMM